MQGSVHPSAHWTCIKVHILSRRYGFLARLGLVLDAKNRQCISTESNVVSEAVKIFPTIERNELRCRMALYVDGSGHHRYHGGYTSLSQLRCCMLRKDPSSSFVCDLAWQVTGVLFWDVDSFWFLSTRLKLMRTLLRLPSISAPFADGYIAKPHIFIGSTTNNSCTTFHRSRHRVSSKGKIPYLYM